MIFPIRLLMYCNVNNIFLVGNWAFWAGSFYPSNTLDRTVHDLFKEADNTQKSALGCLAITEFFFNNYFCKSTCE